jgi:hypothetical protein
MEGRAEVVKAALETAEGRFNATRAALMMGLGVEQILERVELQQLSS